MYTLTVSQQTRTETSPTCLKPLVDWDGVSGLVVGPNWKQFCVELHSSSHTHQLLRAQPALDVRLPDRFYMGSHLEM